MSRYGRGWPLAEKGMTIGLLGGSFNPPHAGHVEMSLLALRRLGLDQVWWLVTPGNPLKANDALPSQAKRVAACRTLVCQPRFVVTGLETVIGTRFTLDTVRAVRARYRGVNFVWMMGADNLAQFHRWRNWQALAREIPIAIVDRPGSGLKAVHSPAGIGLANYRLREEKARLLPSHKPPAWVFLHGLKSPLSSTQKRSQGERL